MRPYGVRTPPRPTLREQSGVLGMRDAQSPVALSGRGSERVCNRLLNVHPNSMHLPTHLRGRPGFTPLGPDEPVGAGRVQWLGQYTRTSDLAEFTCAVVAGVLYTYSWNTETWTARSMSGATLSATDAIAAVTFAGKLILSDGGNPPVAWDGSSWTTLSACPPLYGQPVVYFAKLTGIMATDRTTIVWSEENDPELGYDSGGYNNAWAVTQTADDALVALAAREEGLLIFRRRSTTAVFGAISPEFTSTGTREAVDDRVGAGSPFAALPVGRSVYWLDADGRVQRHTVGVGLHREPPVWRDAEVTCRRITLPALDRVRITNWDEMDAVLIAVPDNAQIENSRVLVYHVDSGRFLGVWEGEGLRPAALGAVKNLDGEPVVVFGRTDGRVYAMGSMQDGPWTDDGAAIEHEVLWAAHGYDMMAEKLFDRIDLTLMATGPLTGVSIGWLSPAAESMAALALDAQAGRPTARWDEVQWDNFQWAGQPLTVEGHVAVGLDLVARWMIPVVRHRTLGEPFAVSGIAVTILPLSVEPRIR